MKNLIAVAITIVAIIIGVLVAQELGYTVPILTEMVNAIGIGRDDVPSVNEAGDKASDAATRGAQEVASWSLTTWKLIIIGLIAAGLTILWIRNPRFKYISIGIFIGLVIFIGFLPQF